MGSADGVDQLVDALGLGDKAGAPSSHGAHERVVIGAAGLALAVKLGVDAYT